MKTKSWQYSLMWSGLVTTVANSWGWFFFIPVTVKGSRGWIGSCWRTQLSGIGVNNLCTFFLKVQENYYFFLWINRIGKKYQKNIHFRLAMTFFFIKVYFPQLYLIYVFGLNKTNFIYLWSFKVSLVFTLELQI